MSRIETFFDKVPVDGIKGLCQHMTGKALRSPYRSTVPLLSLVEHSQAEWHMLLQSLAAPLNLKTYFEYCVASPKPGGTPSQTDVLLMSNSTVWAIEAKWTEPRYQTVEKRINKPESDGTDSRNTINGWLKYIQPFATQDLRVDDFSNVVYQVLHRAASACAVANEQRCRPHLVYLHFHPSPSQSSATTVQYLSDLRYFHSLIGKGCGLECTMVEMPLEPTPAFDAIKALDKRNPESEVHIKAALCRERLFTFGNPKVMKVGVEPA